MAEETNGEKIGPGRQKREDCSPVKRVQVDDPRTLRRVNEERLRERESSSKATITRILNDYLSRAEASAERTGSALAAAMRQNQG